MAQRPEHLRRPGGFFWQGLLILLPVIILAAVGFHALQQDKSLATAQAKERAHEIADSLERQMMRRLYPLDNGSPTYHTNYGALFPAVTNLESFGLPGDLNSTQMPLRFDPPDPQPVDLDSLTSAQRELWLRAFPVACGALAVSGAVAATLEELLATQPPQRFAALAEYELGMLHLREDRRQRAAEAFERVLTSGSNAVTEAGLPLLQLARLHLLALWPKDRIMLVWTQAVDAAVQKLPPQPPQEPNQVPITMTHTGRPFDMHPWLSEALPPWNNDNSLAPRMAEAADRIQLPLGDGYAPGRALFRGGSYLAKWEKEAQRLKFENQFRLALRQAIRAAAGNVPRLFWFDAEDGPRLAARIDYVLGTKATDSWSQFMLIPESEAARLATIAIGDIPSVPPYLGVSVELAGRIVVGDPHSPVPAPAPPGKGGGPGSRTVTPGTVPETLALARRAEQGLEFLAIRVHLLSPQLLYSQQRDRLLWFGLLIVASALAAVFGFFFARRAFRRQQMLADLKSNFVSSVSHELRAPLASVRLMAENLERGKIADQTKQREYYRFIVQECRRLGALVENVLDFARIEQGRKQYDFEPTDMTALVGQTVKLMEPTAAEKGVELVIPPIVIPPNDSQSSNLKSQISVDASAIQQALINLLDNAIKHSPAGATVVVGLTPPSPSAASGNSHASRFTLYVQDSGPGIPREEHEKIFQRFYRRGPELRRETQGVGIGLSIVRHIVEAHGGRVVVESAVGKGSRFTIELPLHENRQPT